MLRNYVLHFAAVVCTSENAKITALITVHTRFPPPQADNAAEACILCTCGNTRANCSTCKQTHVIVLHWPRGVGRTVPLSAIACRAAADERQQTVMICVQVQIICIYAEHTFLYLNASAHATRKSFGRAAIGLGIFPLDSCAI